MKNEKFQSLPKKEEIKQKFEREINNFKDLNEFVYKGKASFFRYDKEKGFYKLEKDFFQIFPELIKLAYEIEQLFPELKVKVLETSSNEYLRLSRKKVCLILFLSFLGMIENEQNPNPNKNSFRVSRLLSSSPYQTQYQFSKCLINYFTVVGKWIKEKNDKILNEEIIYTRENIPQNDYIKDVKLCKLEFKEGSMFNGDESYCVDFANKYIGGGVLNGGCVQEEILFAVEPEALASLFFMEVMDKNDAIGIYNIIEYSKYSGYGFNFKYEGCAIPLDGDQKGIKKHRIIAIDATPIYSGGYYQNSQIISIKRDIHKAYVGFNLINSKEIEECQRLEKKIATGNWGCGAFGGNHQLKFIQQWIAASFAGVKILNYYHFNDKNMRIPMDEYKNIIKKSSSALDWYNILTSRHINSNSNLIYDIMKLYDIYNNKK